MEIFTSKIERTIFNDLGSGFIYNNRQFLKRNLKR